MINNELLLDYLNDSFENGGYSDTSEILDYNLENNLIKVKRIIKVTLHFNEEDYNYVDDEIDIDLLKLLNWMYCKMLENNK